MEDILKFLAASITAITAITALIKILKNQKSFEEKAMVEIKEIKKDICELKKDSQSRTQEETWERELRMIVAASKEFLSDNETLMDFALYKADKFIRHVMSSMPLMLDIESFDYVCKNSGVILKDCVSVAFKLMGDRFVEEFYDKHITKAEKYQEAVKTVLEDRYNDKKRRVFMESSKFLQTFLRDIHDAYYIIREEEIAALRD